MSDFPIIWGLGVKSDVVALIFLALIAYKLWKWLEPKIAALLFSLERLFRNPPE